MEGLNVGAGSASGKRAYSISDAAKHLPSASMSEIRG